MLYIYTVEYYSTIKKNEIMPFAATWMDQRLPILSEVNQTEKGKCCINIPYMWNPQRSDTDEPIYKAGTDPQT